MNPILKRVLKILGGLLGLLLLIVAGVVVYVLARWDKPNDRQAPRMTAPRDSMTVARGEYLFKFSMQCWGCHSPAPADPLSLPKGGMLFDLRNAGPGFGIYYSRNITPDSATGIGGWTDGEIVQAIREGVRQDRHTLFPIMPIDWYDGISDDDALAIVAYLRSIPPVHNEVPKDERSFFAKALTTFGVLKPMPAITAPITAPAHAPTAEYGKYIVQHVAGCADCHTPRNLQDGSFFLDSLFAGGTILFGEGESHLPAFARNITPHETDGIGRWSEGQFIDAVTAGMRPNGTVLSPHMPYAYYKFLTAEDLHAAYLYLMTLKPLKRQMPIPAYDQAVLSAHGVERGKMMFETRCAECHGLEGKGTFATNVKLGEVAISIDDNDLKEFISNGQLNLRMPAFGKTLTPDDLNDVVAYIRTWK